MRDGADLSPIPPTFEQGIALARRILSGPELHTSAHLQALAMARLAIDIYEATHGEGHT